MAGKAMVHSKFVRSYIRTVGISFLICVVLVSHSRSHPQCLDFFPPFKATRDLTFCREYSDFGCCTSVRDGELRQKYNNLIDQLEAIYPVLPVCNSYVKDILCQECSPYASHIFDAETTQIIAPLPGLCTAYCLDFAHCGHVVSFLTTDQQLQSSLDVSLEYFCELVEIGDMDYCYPDIVQNDVFIHELVTAGEGEGCICVQEFANGLRNPLAGVHAGDGTHRFFIAEQIGVVYVFLKNGTKINEPFLDIRSEVLTSSRRGDERGFLGLSFHPDYENNGRLFIYYSVGTLSDQKIRISEMRVSSDDMNKADTSTERVLLEIDQPAPNHNGGQLLFGEDGYLYLFVGDGGKGGDPFGEIGNGQDLESLLGAVLRIDIDGEENGRPYRIPSDNPFLNVSNAKPEIYAYGTRNMWRCSVDRGDDVTGEGRGRIFCGDVGQDSYEEIDIIEKGGNFGWRMKEGFSCYDDDMCTDDAMGEDILPIHAYSHSVGKSVTGGYVYRGCQSPNLKGHYIFGDFVNGRLFKLIEDKNTGEWNNFDICLGDNSVCNNGLIGTFPGKILSFGEDESGEVYILSTDHESNTHSGGKVHKIVDPGRRGDPLDCDVEHKDVVVIGPTTDFEPSASGSGSCHVLSSYLACVYMILSSILFIWSAPSQMQGRLLVFPDALAMKRG
ncbi:Hhip-like protein [Saccoglossus kowalevskii]|uniref:Hhip-like protein n=1 Tax=Saccoglossus kowalevskii TaxID=10224 RepID=D1LX42_SACKO|nr:Hhip-like protein [Saccoglossus kowalevskii]ACY92548.1 Hhip-like protein [Saccoglossus kowalevskii]